MEQDGQPPAMDMRLMLVNAHEVYLSARMAGFTKGAALYLAACVVCGGPRTPMSAEGGE